MRDYPIDLTSVTLFPARLVDFTRLDDEELRIAEADVPITVAAETFTPLPGAVVSAVKHSLGGEMPSMEVRFAHSVGGVLDTAELNNGFWDGAAVVCSPVDRNNITSLGDALFTGVIDTVALDPVGSSGSFDIRGLAAQAEAFIQTYQPMCRTDLFSSLCQLVAASFAVTGTIDSIIDRFNFTVSGIGSPPADGWFNQGTLETEAGVRLVIAGWLQGSLKITTYQPRCISHLEVGQDITLYPGCDKTGATCRTKFNNKINFQGEDHFLGIKSILGV